MKNFEADMMTLLQYHPLTGISRAILKAEFYSSVLESFMIGESVEITAITDRDSRNKTKYTVVSVITSMRPVFYDPSLGIEDIPKLKCDYFNKSTMDTERKTKTCVTKIKIPVESNPQLGILIEFPIGRNDIIIDDLIDIKIE